MKTETDPNNDMLPAGMTEYLRKMPDQETEERIVNACRDVVARSARSRGDAFSRYSVLILTDHGDIQLRIPVSDLPVVIGRSEKDDLCVDVYGISRGHCSLEREGPFITIRDRDSKNHTYVNGRLIEAEQLCVGDKIEMGKALLTLEVESATVGGDGER